ncbi:TPA: DUF1837 domain-containing protein [Escherichia coli]|nr:DUF1837 domain-containing protein [Escherichia coli]EFN8543093.1 DUF1837 domain-containing protein [Escherichia coli O117]EFN8571764.1 DUF1837 domain-containing protein [Escherichia coli O85:H32]EFL6526737.1 DUF1837 domain-containing protein [Escherichia coli]EFM6503125.1 DUF1837 domain-containing protein [Escherichia coli]
MRCNVMNFQILIDDTFINTCGDVLSPLNNKSILSLVNDFEDGKWRYKNFHLFIWDNIAETSLSSKERAALIDCSASLISAAAENLRLVDKENDISKGSELAEIMLYGIMKHHYGALPIVPKIFYKQNSQDNAKGADSVHLVLHGDDDFTLWFGEAKFYNSIEDARLSSIINSVGDALRTDKLRKENSIITNVNDIDLLISNVDLRRRIKEALSPKNSIDLLKPKIHVPIFILHECQLTKVATSMSSDYIDDIVEYHKNRAIAFFKKQVELLKDVYLYNDISFHIILFPVPDKAMIVDKFVEKVEFHKGEF